MSDHSSQNESAKNGDTLRRKLFSTDHKSVGLRFLWLALFSVVLGMALSLVMRMQLSQQVVGMFAANGASDRLAAITLLHGSLMVFFVLTAAPQCGFGYFLLPLQIGAREMAFPVLSGISFWMTVASLAGIASSVLIAPESGATLWLISVTCFSAAILLASLNICVTTIEFRAKGMTLPRLPITVWAWFITAILSLLIFSILLASGTLLLSDRLLGTHFFIVISQSPAMLPVIWQRWFWFFAQSEVYVAMLPCFGIVTHVLSICSRNPIWKERAVVLALCAVGLFGFCIWGEHMFASGLNPYTPLVFSMLASSLGVPALLLIFCWFGTLWGGKIRLSTAMLFALGFVSLFLTGGLSGIFLARREFSAGATNDALVTGHFHLVMGVAATFAILAALFFWFPKFFGRRLNETLGKIHFWATFAGVYGLFMSMHWLGLLERANSAPFSAEFQMLRTTIMVATVVTVSAQLLFLCNFFWSLWRGEKAGNKNPWRATTLEWFVDSPPPSENFGGGIPIVFRGAYEFGVSLGGEDFVPQHLAPDQMARLR
ncbi:MAG TPA: cbb3-type cytochrome c oxidase subunit I [Candidatus Dormibacteraeota bacterium]|jgi:cytochrome c oxidase subunit 1|nr:cbb3-type cytochrome c oxidase subunit I [Candidatus Dormibacteraeota bacterium]